MRARTERSNGRAIIAAQQAHRRVIGTPKIEHALLDDCCGPGSRGRSPSSSEDAGGGGWSGSWRGEMAHRRRGWDPGEACTQTRGLRGFGTHLRSIVDAGGMGVRMAHNGGSGWTERASAEGAREFAGWAGVICSGRASLVGALLEGCAAAQQEAGEESRRTGEGRGRRETNTPRAAGRVQLARAAS